MRVAILDTSVYIDHWERSLHASGLSAVRSGYLIRQSSVVLSELRRGARTRAAQRLVDSLARTSRIHWEPSAADWWRAGKVIRDIGDAETWDRNKRREFQNDVLIALTARQHGAAVVTTNRRDFELLSEAVGVVVMYL